MYTGSGRYLKQRYFKKLRFVYKQVFQTTPSLYASKLVGPRCNSAPTHQSRGSTAFSFFISQSLCHHQSLRRLCWWREVVVLRWSAKYVVFFSPTEYWPKYHEQLLDLSFGPFWSKTSSLLLMTKLQTFTNYYNLILFCIKYMMQLVQQVVITDQVCRSDLGAVISFFLDTLL